MKAVDEIRKGKAVVVLDDYDRENEGDIVVAGEFCTPEMINFMIRYGRGLVCAPISQKRAEQLGLKRMVEKNEESTKCNFTVSVDAKECRTGISAVERSLTVKKLVDGEKSELISPGHMFPLIAHPGGLSARKGHTEAAIALMKLAGLKEVAVICEIIKDDGEMAREKELMEFCEKHGLEFCTIEDIAGLSADQD